MTDSEATPTSATALEAIRAAAARAAETPGPPGQLGVFNAIETLAGVLLLPYAATSDIADATNALNDATDG